MANIITIPFFDGGELNIPGTETPAISEKVTGFIAKYEPDYLLKALGYPLWKVFKADNYPTPGTQRFQQILNGGVEFTDCKGYTRIWNGLNVEDASPIANYIWYWFSRDNASFFTSMGEVKGKTENASIASVMTKQTRVWKEMIDITHQLWEFLSANSTVYPEFDICQVDQDELQRINIFNL